MSILSKLIYKCDLIPMPVGFLVRLDKLVLSVIYKINTQSQRDVERNREEQRRNEEKGWCERFKPLKTAD